MEDHLIAPWQIQGPNFLKKNINKNRRSLSRLNDSRSFKDRVTFTQQKDGEGNVHLKAKLNIVAPRRKEHTKSNNYNSQGRNSCCLPSRLQIKLVSYPTIQCNFLQGSKLGRFSQKLQTIPKQKGVDKHFQVIQTVYNDKTKKIMLHKQNGKLHKFFNISLKKRYLMQSINKQNQLNFKTQQSKVQDSPNIEQTLQPFKLYTSQDFNLEGLPNQKQMDAESNHMNRKTLNKIKSQPYYNSKDQGLHDVRHTDSQRKNQTNLQNTIKKSSVKNQRKFVVQKLENMDCFKDDANAYTSLQKKNKLGFDQIKKYNLFGPKNLNKKTKKK